VNSPLRGSLVRAVAPVRDQAAALLREAIQTGDLAPGTPLIERELCESLDVSRNTIREAIRTLEAEGLLDIRPHRSPIVTVLDYQTARDHYELRALLESEAARLFADRADESTLRRLQAETTVLAEAIENGTAREIVLAKDGFLEVLFEGARNPTLAQHARMAYARLATLRLRSLQRLQRRMASAQEVRNAVEAMRNHDAEAARAMWNLHVRSAADEALLDAYPEEHRRFRDPSSE